MLQGRIGRKDRLTAFSLVPLKTLVQATLGHCHHDSESLLIDCITDIARLFTPFESIQLLEKDLLEATSTRVASCSFARVAFVLKGRRTNRFTA